MNRNIFIFLFSFLPPFASNPAYSQNNIVVFQSDFGLKDGAVSAMKGVANSVSPNLKLYDVTHEIPPYKIWEAAYRLAQTVPYWPTGTVFVSVVDPGVGTIRKSVVLKTKSGHFIVTPDNGTLTLLSKDLGIAEIREIDEVTNRRKNSEKSYTFHGRDVYAYTGARLAAGILSFEQIGTKLADEVVNIPFQEATLENGKLKGTIAILDSQYGNIWTNIPVDLYKKMNVGFGDLLQVAIFNKGKKVYDTTMPYVHTFADVTRGKPLVYLNSLMDVSFALNQDSFASVHKIASGNNWSVEVTKKNVKK